MTREERTKQLKWYWEHNAPVSVSFKKGPFKTLDEGETTPFSEITTGRKTVDYNEIFIPMVRDYWCEPKCLELEQLSDSEFEWVWAQLRAKGFTRKVNDAYIKANEITIYEQDNIKYRVVDDDKFTDAWFAPLSVYENWKKETGGAPRIDDWFYGYVEDEVFFNASDNGFEIYIHKHFD